MRPFEKWLLIASSAATGITGIVYAWMKYLVESAEPWAVINHPWEPWVLKAHILVAPVMVFAVGLVTVGHIWKHFRNRVEARRMSGLTLMAVLVPMVLSGYLIQAVTGAGWLLALVVAHLVTGGLYLVGLGVHWAVGLRRRNGARKPDVGARQDQPAVERRASASGERHAQDPPPTRPVARARARRR